MARFGLRMTWNVFDWGKRSAAKGEGEAQVVQADENVERLRRRVALQVEKSYRNLELAKEMTITARATLEQARETHRLDGDRYIVSVWLLKIGGRRPAKLLLRPICCVPT
jgi:outer membrane protein TolC